MPMSTKLLLLSFWTALAYCLALFPIFHRVRYVLLTSSYTSGYICPGTCVILDWIVIVHWQFSPKYEGSLIGQFNSKKKLSHLTTPRKMREQVGNPFPYRPGYGDGLWHCLSRTQTSDHGRPDSMFAGCLSSETLPIVLLALPPRPPHFSSFHAPCLFGW